MVKVVNFVRCIVLQLKKEKERAGLWNQTCYGLPPQPTYQLADPEQVA